MFRITAPYLMASINRVSGVSIIATLPIVKHGEGEEDGREGGGSVKFNKSFYWEI